jgi:hypothetical protein
MYKQFVELIFLINMTMIPILLDQSMYNQLVELVSVLFFVFTSVKMMSGQEQDTNFIGPVNVD